MGLTKESKEHIKENWLREVSELLAISTTKVKEILAHYGIRTFNVNKLAEYRAIVLAAMMQINDITTLLEQPEINRACPILGCTGERKEQTSISLVDPFGWICSEGGTLHAVAWATANLRVDRERIDEANQYEKAQEYATEIIRLREKRIIINEKS